DGGVEVVDVEGEVMAPEIAVSRLGRLAVGRLELEHLEVRPRTATVEVELAHDRARMHPEVFEHPVAFGVLEWAEGVDPVAPDGVYEEVVGLVEVRNG